MVDLQAKDLVALVRSAFPQLPGDRVLAILVDVPHDAAQDNPGWATRRRMCADWFAALKAGCADIPVGVKPGWLFVEGAGGHAARHRRDDSSLAERLGAGVGQRRRERR